MKERAKSALLLVLILSSLSITGYLWMGFPGGRAAPVEGIYLPPAPDPQAPPLTALVVPGRVAVHAGEDRHLVGRPGEALFRLVWDDGRLLRRSLTMVMEPHTGEREEHLWRQQGPGFELWFPLALPLRQWGQLYSALAWQQLPEFWVSRFHIYLGGEIPKLVVEGPSGILCYRLREGILDLLQVVESAAGVSGPAWEELPETVDGVAVAPGAYVPVFIDTRPFHIIPDTTSVNELVRKVFFDVSIVRRIEERDGSTIFTDGKRGLRIYPQGGWEFTSPLGGAEDVRTELEALVVAARFAAAHGGLVEDSRIVGLDRLWTARGFRWSVKISVDLAGVPVEGADYPIVVSVGPHGVEAYRWALRKPGPNFGIARSPLAAAAAVSLAVSALGVPEDRQEQEEMSITRVELAYWNQPPGMVQDDYRLEWLVYFSHDRLVSVDVRSGQTTVRR